MDARTLYRWITTGLIVVPLLLLIALGMAQRQRATAMPVPATAVPATATATAVPATATATAVPATATATATAVPATGPIEYSGMLSYYGEWPTIGTIKWQQTNAIGGFPRDLSAYHGGLSVANCALIGHHAILESAAGEYFKMIVFDCAGRDGGHSWMISNGIAGEADHYFAQAYPDLIRSQVRVVVLGHWSAGWQWPELDYAPVGGLGVAWGEK